MIAAVAVFALLDVLIKWVGARYATPQIVFFRALFGLVPLLLLLPWRRGLLAAIQVDPLWPHLARGGVQVIAMRTFYASLQFLPLTTATAIGFATPLFVTALSIPVLGERVGWRRWTAVIAGFAGVLIIMRPGTAVFDPASLLVVSAAAVYAMMLLMGRRFTAGGHPAAQVFWMTLVPLSVSALLLPWFWQVPATPLDWSLSIAIGLVGGTGIFLITLAFRYAPASLIAPIDYTALAWAALWGGLIWGETVSPILLLGAGLIVSAGLYIWWRERKASA
jgi:drug/metabolite transporter (DMT)-like permease